MTTKAETAEQIRDAISYILSIAPRTEAFLFDYLGQRFAPRAVKTQLTGMIRKRTFVKSRGYVRLVKVKIDGAPGYARAA